MKGLIISLMLLTFLGCSSAKPSGSNISVGHVPSIPDRENNIEPQPVSGKTAADFFRDEKIYSGWNLGNTLDSHAAGEGDETTWGNPRVNQTLMNGIKAAGFDIIRIPVTWMGCYDEDREYRLDEHRLKRIAQVVEMANKAGLKAIINLHHDGAVENASKDIGWLSINKARRSKEGYHEVTFQFLRIWTQIAIYFRNYGDWLMFESFNEIHDGNWGNSMFTLMLPQFDIINEWNQLFTDIVRHTGGNNTNRYLLIPGYVTNPKLTLGQFFKMPKDSSPGRQLVTFHYYDPYQFGIEGSRANWGSDADKATLDGDFAPFKEQFVDKGIPVIIGECGAVLQLYPDNPEREELARKSRLDYFSGVFGTAKKYGLVPVYWDNGATTGKGEKFGLFNRNNGQPNSPDSEALIKAMINAVR
ncbi:MAG: glycoside hydrolase family 5 protein [Treponema sp.]|jgi:endoglucanase|nr:glycoside hydrolase family 5 protein [Treponema sp.]